jgi:hypothetical protein
MKLRFVAATALGLSALLGAAGQLGAYPGGTPRFVTNAGPYCASCHASVSVDQLRDMAPDAATNLLPANRHYSAISGGDDRYSKLEAGDRQKLLDAVKAVDANSKVELVASAARVKPMGLLTVTVTTHGGAGPVVGVMLTDNDQRFQSSPVQTEGFLVAKPPQVTGPDGAPQTKFLDARIAGLSKNINYVNIQDVHSDPAANTYPTCKVVYTRRPRRSDARRLPTGAPCRSAARAQAPAACSSRSCSRSRSASAERARRIGARAAADRS